MKLRMLALALVAAPLLASPPRITNGSVQTPVLLFAHIRDHEVDRLRLFSPDCNIDAAGQTIDWIDSVGQSESIAFLGRIVEHEGERARNGALLALSFHAGATDTLINIARHDPRPAVRGKALFWLSQQAGEKAAAALRDAVENDPEAEVRGKAVFGISQLPNDQSISLLIDLRSTIAAVKCARKRLSGWGGRTTRARSRRSRRS